MHLVLNLWIVPATQAKFYDTQWNLRYGLAHLKLKEAAFTEMVHGLVVYVDKVSGHDLNEVMLSDTRKKDSEMVVFAKTGKLVTTVRGLSIVMTDGALEMVGNGNVVGTFENFDMDLSLSEKNENNAFRVRRMPTSALVKSMSEKLTVKQYKNIVSELCSRFLGPIMNLILVALCLTILLRSSLLRRRASFAPAAAVAAMAAVMAAFMSLSNMLAGGWDLVMLGVGQIIVFLVIMVLLMRK